MIDKVLIRLAAMSLVLILSTAQLTASASEIGRTSPTPSIQGDVVPSPEQPTDTPSVVPPPSVPPAEEQPPAAPPEPPKPVVDETLKGKLIVIDAGHGGTETGAIRDRILEKDLTLQIATALQKALEAKGAKVVMTRSDDSFVSLQERVEISNRTQPDIFVSVHINSMPQVVSPMTGVEVYYRTPQSKVLAIVLMNSLVSTLQATDRGIGERNLYVVHHTIAPSVLCEVGFISNPDERALLLTPEYQQKIVQALSTGITTYLTAPRDALPTTPAKMKRTTPVRKKPIHRKPVRKRVPRR
jgi:N-acetylmuramoyl-L-alanine amidase CwlD